MARGSTSSPGTRAYAHGSGLSRYDYVVVGAGAAGLVAARLSASLGVKTVIIDQVCGIWEPPAHHVQIVGCRAGGAVLFGFSAVCL